MQQQRSEYEKRYRDFVFGFTDFIWEVDPEGVFTYIAGETEQVLGYTAEEMLGKTPFEFMAPEEAKRVGDIFEGIREARAPIVDLPNTNINKSGGKVCLLTNGKPFYDEAGEFAGYYGIDKDITKQRHAEEELRRQKEEFETIFQTAKDGLAIIDFEGNFLAFNDAYITISGYPREELLQKSCIELSIPEDVERTKEVFEEVKRKGSVNNFVKSCYRKGGDIVTIDTSIAMMPDGQRLLLSAKDITAHKQLERELMAARDAAEQATRAKSDFLASMSHEIRTPLNGIIGLTNLALKEPLSEKQRHYLEKSQQSSKALLRVINDILDYSRIETGKLSLTLKPFRVQEVMEEVNTLFEHQAAQQGIAFSVHCPKALTLTGDAMRLTQLLSNLLGNALKFTSEGTVSLSAELLEEDAHRATLQFSVRDSGIGIDETLQQKLFGAFVQADSSITRKYGGTGLGLAICKQLATLMGGELRVKSEKGTGSEFLFTATFDKGDVLPLEKQDEPASSDAAPRGRILLVEDSRVNQIVVLGILETLGIESDVAENGREAVEQVEKQAYNLVLMDLHMPVMDGFEAGRRIHAAHPELPIVALSAAMMPKDLERTAAAGMCAHLPKPIDEDAFVELLRELLPAESLPEKLPQEPAGPTPGQNAAPDYYGIDMEALGSRMRYNDQRIRMMLESFCEHFGDPKLRRQFDEIGSKEFKAAVHALKGASGNMSMPRLFELAKGVHDSDDPQEQRQLTPLLLQELDTVVAQLHSGLQHDNTARHADESITPEARMQHITAIEKQLSQNRLVSPEDMAKLETMLSGKSDNDLLKELMRQLRMFAYDEAGDLLRRIVAELEP